MFQPLSEAMGGASTVLDEGAGSLLSELSGVYDQPAEAVAPAPVEVAPAEVGPVEVAPVEVAPVAPAAVEVAPVEPPAPAAPPKEDSGSLLNELTSAIDRVEQPSGAAPLEVETITVEPSVTPNQEPEMTLSPPRIEPPAFFWKPQRRGFLRRR